MPVIFDANKKKEKMLDNKEVNKAKEYLGDGRRPKIGALSAYLERPKNLNFETQESNEEIFLLLRQHWVTNFHWVLLTIIFILAPFLIRIIPLDFFGSLPAGFYVVILLFWYVFTFGFLLVSFLSWYFNVYIITSERIVDVDFYNLLYKQVSSTRIAKIQDVSYKVTGAIPAFFNYGDVFIQTAGEEVNFDFLRVPNPSLIARTIGDLMEKEELQWENR